MKEPNLYDRWCEVNEEFMTIPDLKIIKSAGVYTSRTRVSLHATGFGVPDDSVLLRDQRLDLLEKRYWNEEVMAECYRRYHLQPKGASHTFRFHRTDDRPKAGGCLLSMVLAKSDKEYELMITSRAIEATMAMLADIAFVRRCLSRINDELGIGLDLDKIKISWHVGLMHQNRVFVPVFYYDTRGSRGFERWLVTRPQSEWERICQEHTIKMLHQDGVTGARALWGKRLKEWVYEDRGKDLP